MLIQILMSNNSELLEALELARKAAELQPEEQERRVTIGKILFKMGKDDEAYALVEQILAEVKTPEDRDEAEWLLFQIQQRRQKAAEAGKRMNSSSEKPVRKTEAPSGKGSLSDITILESSQRPKAKANPRTDGPVKTMKGLVRAVQCSESAIMMVTLNSNGKLIKFRTDNYFKVPYTAIGFSSKSNFDPCTQLEKKRAEIEFWSVSGQEYSGIIKSIGIQK
jgi:hypothetical protein